MGIRNHASHRSALFGINGTLLSVDKWETHQSSHSVGGIRIMVQPTSATEEAQVRIWMIFSVVSLTLATQSGSNGMWIFIVERLLKQWWAII